MKGYINCTSAHVRRGAARSYHARMTSSPPSPEASGSDADADRLAASSPATPAAELARIAASRPDLHPALAANPATYPDLVDWLRTSPDPAVQTALTQRTTAPAQPTRAAPTKAEAPAQAEGADAAAPSAKASGTTPRRILRRRPLAIAAAAFAVVLVLAVGGAFAWTRTHRGNPAGAPTGTTTYISGALLSSDWASGSHVAWRIDAPNVDFITGKSDQVLAIDMPHTNDSDDAFYSVTAFDISSGTPTQQWNRPLFETPTYWGELILADNQVIDPATGSEITELPAHINADDHEYGNDRWVIGDKLIVCDRSDTCTGWSSTQPDTELWRTSRPGLSEEVIRTHSSGTRNMTWGVSVENVYCNGSTMMVHLGEVFIDAASGQIGSAPDYPSGCGGSVKPTKNGKFMITDPTGEITAISSSAYLTVESRNIGNIRLKDSGSRIDLGGMDDLYLLRPDLVMGKMDDGRTIIAYAPGRS